MSVSQLPDQSFPITEEGDKTTQWWWRWFFDINSLFKQGFTGTVVTAKLTGAGANGSITFTNGVVTAQTPAT